MVFSIVVYVNMDTNESPILLLSENEIQKMVVQVPLKQEDRLTLKVECESYIVTDMGKLCLSQKNTSTEDKKETEVNADLHKEASAEDASNLDTPLGYPKPSTLVLTEEIKMTSFFGKEPFIERNDSVLVSPFAKEAL